MSKIGFANYVKDRLTGFSGRSNPLIAQDILDHPDLYVLRRNEGGGRNFIPACTGPISLRDQDAVHRDIANFKAALQEVQPVFWDADACCPCCGSQRRSRCSPSFWG